MTQMMTKTRIPHKSFVSDLLTTWDYQKTNISELRIYALVM